MSLWTGQQNWSRLHERPIVGPPQVIAMLLANKIGWAGIAFTLLTAGILLQNFPRSAAGSDSNKEGVADFVTKNEIMKLQGTLHNKGYYPGNVDGIFGLRTRASLRAYQKAEKLPFTGQVDTWTASRLGIRPESTWRNSRSASREVGLAGDPAAGQIRKDKPSAGIRWAEVSPNKVRRKEASGVVAIGDNLGNGGPKQARSQEDGK